MAFERIKTVNGKKYRYLVENKRVNGKVKQTVVEYLGRVPDPHSGNQLEVVANMKILANTTLRKALPYLIFPTQDFRDKLAEQVRSLLRFLQEGVDCYPQFMKVNKNIIEMVENTEGMWDGITQHGIHQLKMNMMSRDEMRTILANESPKPKKRTKEVKTALAE